MNDFNCFSISFSNLNSSFKIESFVCFTYSNLFGRKSDYKWSVFSAIITASKTSFCLSSILIAVCTTTASKGALALSMLLLYLRDGILTSQPEFHWYVGICLSFSFTANCIVLLFSKIVSNKNMLKPHLQGV